MATFQISFEIKLPTESVSEAQDWAEFELGFNGSLSGSNPCTKVDLPADWDELVRHSLRVCRTSR